MLTSQLRKASLKKENKLRMKIKLTFSKKTFKMEMFKKNEMPDIRNYDTGRITEVMERLAANLNGEAEKKEVTHFLEVVYKLFKPQTFTFNFFE